ARHAADEGAQHGGERAAHQGIDGGDPDLPFELRILAGDGELQPLDLELDALGDGEDLPSGRGEPIAVPVALEELGAQLGLEILGLAEDGRMADPQELCRRRQRAGPRDGEHDPQLVPVQPTLIFEMRHCNLVRWRKPARLLAWPPAEGVGRMPEFGTRIDWPLEQNFWQGEFEGREFGSGVSVIFNNWAHAGGGAALHSHPY